MWSILSGSVYWKYKERDMEMWKEAAQSPREWGWALDPLSQPLSGVHEEGR